MSPIDHNYDKLVHNLVNSPETIDGFRSRNLPYTLRFPHQSSYLSVVSSNNYAFQYSSNRLLKNLESPASVSQELFVASYIQEGGFLS